MARVDPGRQAIDGISHAETSAERISAESCIDVWLTGEKSRSGLLRTARIRSCLPREPQGSTPTDLALWKRPREASSQTLSRSHTAARPSFLLRITLIAKERASSRP